MVRSRPYVAYLALTIILLVFWCDQPDAQPKRAADVERRQLDVIGQLDELDKKTAQMATQERRLTAEAINLNRLDGRDRVKLTKLEVDRRNSQKLLTPRLKALYVHGGYDRAGLAMANKTPIEALFVQQSLIRIVEFDLNLIKDYNSLQNRLIEAKEQRLKRRLTIQTLTIRLDRAKIELKRQKSKQTALLLRLEEKRQDYRQAVVQLDVQARQLSRELDAIEARARINSNGSLAQAKGKLPWPVRGSVGQPVGTNRNGVLIKAAEGQPVVAVGKGKVVFAGWVKGFGQVAIVDHGSRYYTLSGHLQEVRVGEGDEVVVGQTIGLVGRAGLATAGLYFEIRHRDRPQKPRQWLAGISR